MDTQPPKRARNINAFLAVTYGLLMFLTVVTFFFLIQLHTLSGLMDNEIPIVFSSPIAIRGAGPNLYLVEHLAISGGRNDKDLYQVHFFDGEHWKEGPELDFPYRIYSWGEALLVSEKERFLLIEGDSLKNIFPNPFSCWGQVINYKDGIVNVLSSDPKVINITYFDRTLTEKWSREIKIPEEFASARCGHIYRPVATGDRLWFFWRKDDVLYYAPLKENGWGEMKKAPFSPQVYRWVSLPRRAVVLIELIGSRSRRSISIKELQKNGEWLSLPKLVPPSHSAPMIDMTEYQGKLIALFQGFTLHLKELDQGVWRDAKKDPPLLEYHALILWLALILQFLLLKKVWIFSLPLGLLLIAHYHFKLRKNLRTPIQNEEIELASLGRRTLAFILDTLVSILPALMIAGIGLTKVADIKNHSDLHSVARWLTAAGVAGFLCPLYFFIAEAFWSKTIGKALLGLRVATADGGPCTLSASLIRNLIRVVEGFFYYLPVLIAVAATEKYQRIGDLVADTIVIREKKQTPETIQ